MARLLILLGTRKGVFVLQSDEARKAWELRGPMCEHWPIFHVNFDPDSQRIYAVGASPWYGPAVWQSADLGSTWTHSSNGITYGNDGPAINTLWNITPARGSIFVGADPAGLFRSDDGGLTFTHVAGLRDHPTRPNWFPGNGGLCLHSIVPHPTDPQQLWVAISAVGTFYTSDGGDTWEPRNQGLRADYMPEEAPNPEVGYCVHKLAPAPGNQRLYQQNHQGVYRSDNGGLTWDWINDGLPSDYGFPIAVHPRDPETAYVVPLGGDDRGRYAPNGSLAVWRTRDGGETWQRLSRGLPQSQAFVSVLREALAVDSFEPAGTYIGTRSGHLFVSNDEGESWREVASYLPGVLSVETAVVDN